MGNLYRIMGDITLNFRIHKKQKTFSFEVNTGDNVSSLIEKIKQHFDCVEVNDIIIKLWKVNVPNKDNENTFLNLVLEENENITELTGELTRELNSYWGGDKGKPLEGHTHVIVVSSYLYLKIENEQLTEEMSRLNLGPSENKKGTDKYLQKLCNAGVIKKEDELWISKDYTMTKEKKRHKNRVDIGCRVTKISNGVLTVKLLDHGEKEKEVSALNDLEKEFRPKDNHDCTVNICIKRDGKWVNSIREEYKRIKKSSVASFKLL